MMSFNQEFLCQRRCEANRALIAAWAMVKERKSSLDARIRAIEERK